MAADGYGLTLVGTRSTADVEALRTRATGSIAVLVRPAGNILAGIFVGIPRDRLVDPIGRRRGLIGSTVRLRTARGAIVRTSRLGLAVLVAIGRCRPAREALLGVGDVGRGQASESEKESEEKGAGPADEVSRATKASVGCFELDERGDRHKEFLHILIWQYTFVNTGFTFDADRQFLFVNTGARGPDFHLRVVI